MTIFIFPIINLWALEVVIANKVLKQWQYNSIFVIYWSNKVRDQTFTLRCLEHFKLWGKLIIPTFK